ncbi:hypothetical protein ThimaDRAFT_0526 [Thiocapsa marina 5811]|uniref:Uncharacterized protein n=1 Tax=Thiocapsa marina 5811 TaxID=768671 RepID=F9U6H5_9GAMM|nr:hypothetical protein ThimaDRAFT_0526 [Thiocapsa marina 5811]
MFISKEDQNMPILYKIDRALSCIPVGSVKTKPHALKAILRSGRVIDLDEPMLQPESFRKVLA